MVYRKPFTPQQRREAIRAYRSYRKHRSYLRRYYPPMGDEQRQVLRKYGEALREMARELRKPDRSVDVDALTRADAWAKWLAIEYQRLQDWEN